MKPLRQLSITAVVSDGIRDCHGVRDLFAEQVRVFHFGLLRRECRDLNVLAAGPDLAHRLGRLQPDIVFVDAGGEEAAMLLAMCSNNGDMPYPVICFNPHADYEAMMLALESGASSYVGAAFSVERAKMEIDVAMARFAIHRRLRRELDETRRELDAISGRSISDNFSLSC